VYRELFRSWQRPPTVRQVTAAD